jgi:hypothetical membrane protein
MGIITAEALYPSGYSTGGSYISDLGGTEPPDSVVVQPSAGVFDGTMLLVGVLVVAATVCLWTVRRRKSLTIPLAVFGLGALFVGVFPGHTGLVHQIFAEVTFISGAVAAILSCRSVSGPFRCIAVALGAISLVNLLGYVSLQDRWFVAYLGVGGLERWVAYPIVLWALGMGGYLLAARDEAPADQAAPAE